MSGNSRIKIITDEISPRHAILDFGEHSRLFADIIENSSARFTVGIFGDWGTGKTTLMKMILQELEKNSKILPVWFDAWRYEREDDLAVIPFLRTVSIALDNFLNKLEDQNEKSRWSRLGSGLNRTFQAFINSSKISFGVPGVQVETNLESVKNSLKLKAGEEIGKHVDTIYYHSTGFLEHALDNIRVGENGDRYRIVVFVDDLDRCTPQNGLEVLESIKSFFDIEGIVYVIGMNHATIDSLIEEKFKSKNKTVTGLDYMKKIVQLPFHIPEWSREDIRAFVDYTITNELGGADTLQRILREAFSIIIQAIDTNPREAKRFINSVILSQAVFNYLPLEELLIVHALKFRPEWNPFLDFITEADRKEAFFSLYKTLVGLEKESSSTIEHLAKGLEGVYKGEIDVGSFEEQPNFRDSNKAEFREYYKLAKEILQLWPDIERNYPGFLLVRNPLSTFLLTTYHDVPIMKGLADINNLEVFRRASRTTSDVNEPARRKRSMKETSL
jgi:hypothetical protein